MLHAAEVSRQLTTWDYDGVEDEQSVLDLLADIGCEPDRSYQQLSEAPHVWNETRCRHSDVLDHSERQYLQEECVKRQRAINEPQWKKRERLLNARVDYERRMHAYLCTYPDRVRLYARVERLDQVWRNRLAPATIFYDPDALADSCMAEWIHPQWFVEWVLVQLPSMQRRILARPRRKARAA